MFKKPKVHFHNIMSEAAALYREKKREKKKKDSDSEAGFGLMYSLAGT